MIVFTLSFVVHHAVFQPDISIVGVHYQPRSCVVLQQQLRQWSPSNCRISTFLQSPRPRLRMLRPLTSMSLRQRLQKWHLPRRNRNPSQRKNPIGITSLSVIISFPKRRLKGTPFPKRNRFGMILLRRHHFWVVLRCRNLRKGNSSQRGQHPTLGQQRPNGAKHFDLHT